MWRPAWHGFESRRGDRHGCLLAECLRDEERGKRASDDVAVTHNEDVFSRLECLHHRRGAAADALHLPPFDRQTDRAHSVLHHLARQADGKTEHTDLSAAWAVHIDIRLDQRLTVVLA